MDKKLVSLLEDGDTDAMETLLKDSTEQQVCSLIDLRAVKGKGDPVALVRALLQGSPCVNVDGIYRRLWVYRRCIALLQAGDLHSKTASQIVSLLMLEADGFPGKYLAELAGLFVDSIKNGQATSSKSLELFPKILSALEAQDVVHYGGRQMKGPEYKSHVLNSFCSGRWEPQCVIHLATMFKDVPLTSDELKFVVTKIVRLLKEIDVQELPPVVYQLLLLATRGHKKAVLEGVTSFFVEQDRKCKIQEKQDKEMELSESVTTSDQLRHTEGTIILHITFAIKQDQDLGREFIKYLKAHQQCSSKKVLAPFNLALALSIARIHRFEEQIFELLKSAVLKSFKDCDRQKASYWVREMAPGNQDITQDILDAIDNSAYGWDHVTQGLVQLGFTLMDAYGPRGAFGRLDTVPTPSNSPTQRACQLGAKILINTFKVHDMVRVEILEQILNRVVTKTATPVTHFLDLLSDTIQAAPQTLLDSVPKVKEAFDYLSYLPVSTANALLKAVLPLLKISISLKDGLILVLRKAMFSRQLEARKIAVSGFLLILQHFKVLGGITASQSSQSSLPFSMSQITVDIHRPNNPAGNEAICLEILGNLRRCFTQQADVRMLLYEGLYDVMCKNYQLAPSILSLLLAQVKRYYEKQEDVNPPLRLELCIQAQGDQVFLTEPLAHLLGCMQQCLMKSSEKQGDQSEEDNDTTVQSEIEQILESLTRRMIKSELEDFELDKSADFSLGNSVGVRNHIFAILVLGTYEGLIEYNFETSDFDKEILEFVIQLHKNFHNLSAILKEKATSGGGGGKRRKPGGSSGPSNKQLFKSLLSLKCVSHLLRTVFSDQIPAHQEALTALRECSDFLRFVVGVALQKLQQIQTTGSCDGSEGHNKDKVFKYVSSIAKVLLKQYMNHVQTSGDQRERNKQLYSQCLEGFMAAMSIMSTWFKPGLAEFLSAFDRRESGAAAPGEELTDDDLHVHIKRYQRLAMTLITSESEDHNVKDVVPILTIISNLSELMTTESQEYEQVCSWVLKVCTDHNIDEAVVAKALVSQLLSLSARNKNCGSLIKELSQDIHSQQGDIDQEVDIEDRTNYALVNPRMAAPHVLLLLLGHIDRELDDTEWLLNRMKADLSAEVESAQDSSSQGLTQRETMEKNICSRLGMFINGFHELVQSAVPMGPCVESMFKQLTRLYGVLGLLVKFYLAMYTMKAGHLCSRFEKLVKLSGTQLTQHVYSMITYVQASVGEQLVQTADKAKKKGKQKAESAGGSSKQMKSLKDEKSIPNLIFAIEQYERYLIQLSKKSKVNLMEHIKLSTSRDFRINTAALTAAIQNQSDSSSDDECDKGNGSDEEQENSDPPAKKQKGDKASGGKGKTGGKGKKGKLAPVN